MGLPSRVPNPHFIGLPSTKSSSVSLRGHRAHTLPSEGRKDRPTESEPTRVFVNNLCLGIAIGLESSNRSEDETIAPSRLPNHACLHRKLDEAGATRTKSTCCGFCGVRAPCGGCRARVAGLVCVACLVLLVPMALQRLRLAPPSTIAPLPAALPHRILARLMIHAHKGSMPT